MPKHYDDKKKKKVGPKPSKASKPTPPSKPAQPKPSPKSKPKTLELKKPKHPTMGMDYLEWVEQQKKRKGKGAAYGPNLLSEAVRKKYKKK